MLCLRRSGRTGPGGLIALGLIAASSLGGCATHVPTADLESATKTAAASPGCAVDGAVPDGRARCGGADATPTTVATGALTSAATPLAIQAPSGQGRVSPAGVPAAVEPVEITLEFKTDPPTLSTQDRANLARAVKTGLTAGANSIAIIAGPGSGSNPFEKLVLAQKRARFVRNLVSAGMVITSEYDPLQADDTVRIVAEAR